MANQDKAFTALGDPTRRKLLEKLARGPLAVGILALGLPVTRPAVSQHLKILKDAGLVVSRVEGTRRIYLIDPKGVEAMRRYLDQFWDSALASFKAVAERSAQRRTP